MSSRFKKRLAQLHGSRQRRRGRDSDDGASRIFTADDVEVRDIADTQAEQTSGDPLVAKWRDEGAKSRSTSRGEAHFLVRAHPRRLQHGKKRLGEGAVSMLDCFRKKLNDVRLHSTDPRRLAYLDLETNGLSKTSYPFCIGIGLWEGDSFAVYHYFTPREQDEPAALSACAEILGDVDGLCTFNGSSFDVRMLQRRFRKHGIEHNLDTLAHLDLLHLARKLLPDRDSHKLSRLEEDVLGFERTGDIPGAKIPGRWRQYEKAGEPSMVLDIFDHNRLDILSMVVLIAELAEQVDRSQKSDASAETGASAEVGATASSSGKEKADTKKQGKPRSKLASRLSRSYALRKKAASANKLDKRRADKKRAAEAPPEPQQPEDDRSNVALKASFSRSQLKKGMPVGTRLRELRAMVERLEREGQKDQALAHLHEMVALAPRNPFALEALVAQYRQRGDHALAEHFAKRLETASPF